VYQEPTITKNYNHKSASFGGKATAMSDVFISDVLTIAMESTTPFPDDYWCHVDEYMESGNWDDLYCQLVDVAEHIESTVDTNLLCLAIANNDIVGVDCDCANLSIGKNGVDDNNIHVIPVCECLNSIQFTIEEHLLICPGQACNDAHAPLYLVDEIMDITQDECDQGVIMNQLYFCKRESFMKHLMTCFHSPKDHLLHIGIESLHQTNMAYCRELEIQFQLYFLSFWIRFMIYLMVFPNVVMNLILKEL